MHLAWRYGHEHLSKTAEYELGGELGATQRPRIYCSCSQLVMADAVEKVRGIPLTRNNRIIGVDSLNRTCASVVHFKSILLGEPPKIFFQQHRPRADVNADFIGPDGELSLRQWSPKTALKSLFEFV